MHIHSCYVFVICITLLEVNVSKSRGQEVSTISLPMFVSLDIANSLSIITSLNFGANLFCTCTILYLLPPFSLFLVYHSILYLMLCTVGAEHKHHQFYCKITYIKFLQGNIPHCM
jgi:hypothetical protein